MSKTNNLSNFFDDLCTTLKTKISMPAATNPANLIKRVNILGYTFANNATATSIFNATGFTGSAAVVVVDDQYIWFSAYPTDHTLELRSLGAGKGWFDTTTRRWVDGMNLKYVLTGNVISEISSSSVSGTAIFEGTVTVSDPFAPSSFTGTITPDEIPTYISNL